MFRRLASIIVAVIVPFVAPSVAAAATVAVGAGNVVLFTGAAAHESLTVTQNGAAGTSYTFDVSGQDVTSPGDTSCTDDNYNPADTQLESTCTNAILVGLIAGIDAQMSAGNDQVFSTGITIPMVLRGGDGHDSLQGGTAGDTLEGGAGNDSMYAGDGVDSLDGGADDDQALEGGAGNDTIIGGAGDDRNFDGGAGADTISGGDGQDAISYSTRTNGVTIDPRTPGGDGESGEGDSVAGDFEDITGGDGNDLLVGLASATALTGGAGNDQLLSIGATRDFDMSGGTGNDTLDASSAGAGVSHWLQGGSGDDVLTGGIDSSTLMGDAGADTVNGGGGDDWLYGGDGIDVLAGGDGNDELEPGSSIGPAPDFVRAGDGADTVTGGADFDTVSYNGREVAVTVDLAIAGGDGQAGENDGIALDVEAARGGDAADVLLGSAGPNRLEGDGGADTIDGRAGIDELIGDADADTINASGDLAIDVVECGTLTSSGGADSDRANLDYLDVLEPDADCENVARAAAPPFHPIRGTMGADVLRGTALANLLVGLDGNDVLSGMGGSDELLGGRGNDRVLGGAGTDFLHGGPGRDRLDGQAGKDVLVSRDGARGDIVTCTRVNLATRAGRAQRDIALVDTGDTVVNLRYCARVAVG